MRSTFWPVFAAVLVSCCGCRTTESVEETLKRRPAGAFMMDAKDYLADLWRQGRLPGMEDKGHGDLKFGREILAEPIYPATQDFTLLREGDASTHHYTVERELQGGPMRLKRAWKTDADGHLIKEFSVP